MTGLFDLATPTRNLEFYGIRLTDGTSTNSTPNDLLNLGVRRDENGVNNVEFFRLDAMTSTFTSYGSFLLDPLHTQISFTLTKASAGLTDPSRASFFYVDSGVDQTTQNFGTTTNIFTGETFTRAEFAALSPVPELAIALVLGAGLAGLAAAGRRARHK